jgi:hypothetical protein
LYFFGEGVAPVFEDLLLVAGDQAHRVLELPENVASIFLEYSVIVIDGHFFNAVKALYVITVYIIRHSGGSIYN